MSQDIDHVPCWSTATAKALRTSAARLLRDVHRARGDRRRRAALSCEKMVCRNLVSSCLLASNSITSQSACRAICSKRLRSTVLPTPRSPVMIMDCSERPRSNLRNRISNDRVWSSRPISTSGEAPALGVYGLSKLSTLRAYRSYIDLSIANKPM